MALDLPHPGRGEMPRVHGLPGMTTVAFVALILVLTVAFAVIVQALIDRLVPPGELEPSQHSIADLIIQPASGVYGVLLAFILAAALAGYQDLRRGIAIEANAVIDLVQLSDNFPAPTNTEIRAAALTYARSVVTDEWPMLAKGTSSPETTAALSELWHPISRFSPATAGDANLHSVALDLVQTISTQRRLRILAAGRSIPMLVWLILDFGGISTIVLSSFSPSPPRRRLRYAFVAVLAVLIALSLASLYVLGHPFGAAVPLIPPQRLLNVQEWLSTMR